VAVAGISKRKRVAERRMATPWTTDRLTLEQFMADEDSRTRNPEKGIRGGLPRTLWLEWTILIKRFRFRQGPNG
jgi:hypothetical protein